MFAALGNNFSALSEINSFKPTDAQKQNGKVFLCDQLIFHKSVKTIQWGKSAFSTSSARRTGYPHVKNELEFLYTKINSKWNKERKQQNSQKQNMG